MGARRPRWGSLQFYPRNRVEKEIHRVNWSPVSKFVTKDGILGFIAYKAGMATAVVKDNTDASMTKGKRLFVPVTILEVPNMKVFSVRFYKFGIVIKEVVVSADKELRKVLKLGKEAKNLDKEIPQGYDDIRLIVYSLANQTGFKKKPDLIEIAFNAKDKLEFAKSLIGKEITPADFKFNLVDMRGVTKGKGLCGPMKRFGITKKSHKSEKGVRRPGSLGPWHPHRVIFRVPLAGQVGMFSRVHYNFNLLSTGKIAEKNINPASGFKHYGNVKSNYVIIKGSVQGPVKRQVMITPSFRPTRGQAKRKYEFVELA